MPIVRPDRGFALYLDPHYASGPLSYITRLGEAISGHRIIVDPALRRAVEIHHDREIIKVQPGLTLAQYHWAIARSCLRVCWGAEAAPEFGPPQARLTLVLPDIPTQRGLLTAPSINAAGLN